ncbi:hypothetical protein M2140_000088 [Clostridiales Family XIII bacterium PM5-7]
MTKLIVMNSTGARKSAIIDENSTFVDVTEMEEFCGILVGNQFTLNGGYLTEAEMTTPLNQLEGYKEETNILSAIKNANGAM